MQRLEQILSSVEGEWEDRIDLEGGQLGLSCEAEGGILGWVSMKPSLEDLVEGAFGREGQVSVLVRVLSFGVLWVYVRAFWRPYAIQIWPLDEVLAHR